MDIFNNLNGLSAKIQQQAAIIQTEEATKSAFVMPFISQILGYDVFDPTEVIPEFICDVGTKKVRRLITPFLKAERFRS